ncbi:WGR domain-containing protein [Mesorhizobium sp. B2-7-3]|uniref:WGR domain-containing protein n=1 Tax=Mesorhizobium sp. B2-7-3 TaxID=2589907 RepID=UPI0032B18C7D
MALQPTLFGDVSLVRQWGRIGTRGRQKSSFSTIACKQLRRCRGWPRKSPIGDIRAIPMRYPRQVRPIRRASRCRLPARHHRRSSRPLARSKQAGVAHRCCAQFQMTSCLAFAPSARPVRRALRGRLPVPGHRERNSENLPLLVPNRLAHWAAEATIV